MIAIDPQLLPFDADPYAGMCVNDHFPFGTAGGALHICKVQTGSAPS
jgi:hypothetical protein